MKTEFFHEPDAKAIARAGEILRSGGLVAIPTETVYGLAANAYDAEAVKNIFIAKGRPGDNPLIVHIADLSELKPLVRSVPESAKQLAAAFWPGPLTMILPKSDRVPYEVTAGLETVAVRFPSHPVANAIIRAAGLPLAAPSANLSGKPSPTNALHVYEDMNGRIDAIVDGGDCHFGVESTVITLAGEKPRLLRPGAVTLEMLRAVIGEVEMDSAVIEPLAEGEVAASPGMKYKHYSPKAEVYVLSGSPEAFIRYINSHCDEKTAALCYDEEANKINCATIPIGKEFDFSSQAHLLFNSLRRCDELGMKRVYAHIPRRDGISLAIYNRLMRAAGFKVIYV